MKAPGWLHVVMLFLLVIVVGVYRCVVLQVPKHELRVVDDGIQEIVDISVKLPGMRHSCIADLASRYSRFNITQTYMAHNATSATH